jgi:uncharacterized protein (DUF58 family)
LLADNWIIPLVSIFLLGLALDLPTLSIISLGMGLFLWIAALWRDRILNAVEYSRNLHYTRGFSGETIDVRINVRNKKLMPMLWLITSDLWPRPVGPENEDVLQESHMHGVGRLVNVFRLPSFGHAKRKYNLKLKSRGIYRLGPVRMESGDPLGLYTNNKEIGSKDLITVYPEMANLPQLDFPTASPFGDKRVFHRLFEDPSQPIGVRDYQITDELRRVHWPATARTGKMQSKVYQPTAERVMSICLNTATSERHWEGVYPDVLEHLVRTAAAVAHHATFEGYQVGLISNGTMTYSDQPYRILPGRSKQQLVHILTALAGVTPLVGLPFDRYLLKELPKLPYGIVMTVITAVVNDLLLETLFEARRHGRKIVLFSVAEEPPPDIQGMTMLHFPLEERTISEEKN